MALGKFGLIPLLLFLLLSSACTERYPYFIEEPQFHTRDVVDENGVEHPGIYLEIYCEDENAEIRYTLDYSDPSSDHGFVYDEPLYLVSNPVEVRAVAVRVGYDEGPLGVYRYEP